MEIKKVKIPIGKNFLINQRSTSNRGNRNTNPVFKKTESYKILQNTSDFDNSKIDTTTESSVEIMKKISIYKKFSPKQRNNVNIININYFNKNNNYINYINTARNNRILHCGSASNLYKKSNYRMTQSYKNIKNKGKENSFSNVINNSNDYINYNNLTRRSEQQKKMERNSFDESNSSFNEYRNQMKNNNFINIEDLMLLEEIFHDVILSIKMKSNIANECFELINFYNQSSLYNKFENYFKEEKSKEIVHLSILKMLFCAILTYHYSFNKFLFNRNYEYLNIIINLNYKSFLLLCEYISNKISNKERGNIWVKRLRLMLNNNLKHIGNNNKEFKLYLSSIDLNISSLNINVLEIKYYLFLVQKNIKILLRNLNNDPFQSDFYLINHNIPKLSAGEIIKFFRKKIIHIINKNGSVCGNDASFYGGKDTIKDIKVPFLNYKSKKKYCLVLDLDETLISFKVMDGMKNKGILRLRPGLYEFLLSVKNNYELIIFTSATKEYADPLIDAIEKNGKYFDFRLYRQHTSICENEFIKDIGKLGRPMNKLIIVDNLPQNFRLQKENGIMIKPFWGEDMYDTALYELGIILNKIANEFYDTRKGIINYKNDILIKVSSCFSRTEKFE